jgi:hypothetical protein
MLLAWNNVSNRTILTKTPCRPSTAGRAGALAVLQGWAVLRSRPRSPIGCTLRVVAWHRPLPAPARRRPSLRLGPAAALVVQRRRPSSGATSGPPPPVRAAMELEVPDEAESAEAGTVTAEAAWAAESGAAAGNGAALRRPR